MPKITVVIECDVRILPEREGQLVDAKTRGAAIKVRLAHIVKRLTCVLQNRGSRRSPAYLVPDFSCTSFGFATRRYSIFHSVCQASLFLRSLIAS